MKLLFTWKDQQKSRLYDKPFKLPVSRRNLFNRILAPVLLLLAGNTVFADVTLSSSTVAAANIAQGTNNNILNIVKMDVATTGISVNSISFTLSGTHDNNDLTLLSVFYNPTTPSLTGATQQAGNIIATFAAPHTYTSSFNFSGLQAIAAGGSGYFIIVVNASTTATSGNTIKIDAVANPVVFGYTTVPTVINNQTDISGIQTLQAAAITFSSVAIAASNMAQGSTDNVLYAVKAEVTLLPVTINRIQFTLNGTMDNNDLTILNVYYNPTAPTLSGASLMEINGQATFSAPHPYDLNFNYSGQQIIAAGASGYFLITTNVSSSGTNGNTVKIDGAANPVTFSYTTGPTLTNNQTDIAGTKTIAAAAVALASTSIAATNIAQGSNDNILYVVKADVSVLPVTFNRIQFTLNGTHDNNDLTILNVYYNPTAPILSGATLMAVNFPATFAGPHPYDLNFNFSGQQIIAAGASGYFLITTNVNSTATNGNTVKIDGAANPVTFSYTTGPTITNNQTDIAGTKTIAAAAVTLSSTSIAASNLAQGSNDNLLYAVKADASVLPVTINRIQFTVTGTMDNNDLTIINIYYNPTAPTLSGATLMASNNPATFAAPHTYDLFFNNSGQQVIAAGGSGYFIILANVSNSGTNGNTIKIDGAANPVTLSYTTGPTVTNNQTDIAGTKTILGAAVTLTSVSLLSSNIAQGSNDNLLYAVKADVSVLPATFNRMQFTISGTMDNNDLTLLNVYYNATAPTLSGATLMVVNSPATFAAPHSYDLFFNYSGQQVIAAGSSGYFIILANVNNSGTNGNTIKIDGATNPVSFSYTTAPAVTSNQTDIAGTRTILGATVAISSFSLPAANIAQGATDLVYVAKADVNLLQVIVSRIQFTLAGTHDNDDLTVMNIYYNPTAPTIAGAQLQVVGTPATFAAPHAYDLFFNYSGGLSLAAGSSGYFIISFTCSATATTGHTIKLDGAANPVSFTYSTAPAVTNNQTDIAGAKTIQATGVTISSVALAPANIIQNTNDNIIYAVKMDVTTLPVVISRIQFNITGTMDNNDLTLLTVYYNATAPTIAGASLMAYNNPATFAAPHAYDLFFNYAGNQTIIAGGSGYFIITANVDPTATAGNTVKINGAADPVSFTYSTGPTIINNQTDAAGTRTIATTIPLTLIEFSGKLLRTGVVQLQWTTVNEFNTKEFDVQWSGDGQHFSNAGILSAAGYSSLQRQYSYMHQLPLDGNNYYRLKMVDNDARFTYSAIIKIAAHLTVDKITAYPNPFIKELNLQVSALKDETLQFNISDANGKRVASKSFILKKGYHQLRWSLSNFPAGNYFISCANGDIGTIKIEAL